jgi:glutamate synthase domain-containing protein 2
MVNILLKTNIPSFHPSIIPFPGEISKSQKTSMRTKEPVISWDEILIKGAQLAKIPLNHEEPVNTKTVIGPRAGTPLVIETPIYISHMSFGALSKQAKTALAKGSAAQKTLIGCQQYRVCNTGKCPMGIATQDPDLCRRLDVDQAAKKLENFLRVSTEELKDFARLTGNDDVHKLSIQHLCTTNSEISNHTAIEHV